MFAKIQSKVSGIRGLVPNKIIYNTPDKKNKITIKMALEKVKSFLKSFV
jgi:hypothetical protein